MYSSVGLPVYIIAIISLFLITFLLVKFTKKKSDKFNYWFIFSLMLFNFAFHFIKLSFPYRTFSYDLPISIKMVSFYNICAVSVLLFPWLFLLDNKYTNDYISILGIISGFFSFIIVLAPSGNPVTFGQVLGVIQYYVCHGLFFICGVLMFTNKIVTISYRRVFPVMLVGLLSTLTLIYVNILGLRASGIVKFPNNQFSRNFMNTGYVFGISNEMGSFIFIFFNCLVPPCFKFITYTGEIGYIPVIWILCPLSLLLFVLTIIFMIIDHKRVKHDLLLIQEKFKYKRKK